MSIYRYLNFQLPTSIIVSKIDNLLYARKLLLGISSKIGEITRITALLLQYGNSSIPTEIALPTMAYRKAGSMQSAKSKYHNT